MSSLSAGHAASTAASNAAQLEAAYANLREAFEDVADAHQGRAKRQRGPPSRFTYHNLSVPGINSEFVKEHDVPEEDLHLKFTLGKRKPRGALGGAAAVNEYLVPVEEQTDAVKAVPVEPEHPPECIICQEEMDKDDEASLGCVTCTCAIHKHCWEGWQAINVEKMRLKKTCPSCHNEGGMTRLSTSFPKTIWHRV